MVYHYRCQERPRMRRNTSQRQAIQAAFEQTKQPLTPAEVLAVAQTLAPGVGIATVYRALKALTDEQWLVTVDLPGEAQRYERSGKHHHHHFHCRGCGQVFDVESCARGLERLLPSDFTLADHEVVLYGSCAACATSG
jgi:Fur family transcriptional regulator, ferric uptake regulator